MVDHLTPEERSALMGRIRGKDTKPEMLVRRLRHGMGYRYRLHARNLPGNPDLAFPARKKVIFVNGCFWHQHDCPKARRPSTNVDFWNEKLDRNMVRDKANFEDLHKEGWSSLVVWECETKDEEELIDRLIFFLDS